MPNEVPNHALVFLKPPTHLPVRGEHIDTKDIGPFDLDQALPSGDSEGLLLETQYVSLDPYLRGLLRDPAVKSYMPAIPFGKPISAGTISKVLKSNIDGFVEGDLVRLNLPIAQYNLYSRKKGSVAEGDWRAIFKIPTPKDGGVEDARHYLGALGMPGLTAYSSLYEIGKPKKGEIIVVSSAAGAVGQLVGQIAKEEGLVVFGSVGSDDKLKYIIDELGFDAGWNYKKEKSSKEAIERLVREHMEKKGEKWVPADERPTGSGGIDIFYDNVGGEQLEGALDTLNLHGR
jgi:NADPH-dependent curcumin reductase CurA